MTSLRPADSRLATCAACTAVVIALAAAAPTASAFAQSSAEMGRDSIVDRMIHATVEILCERGARTIPMGSGTVIVDARIVITNAHVLEACGASDSGAHVVARAYDGAVAPAVTVRTSTGADVAVLRLTSPLPATAAPLRSDSSARVMEPVVALGYPAAARFAGASGDQARATIGVISRVAARESVADGSSRWLIEHGAPIYPGNSGGPLFDECGAVLGINAFVPVDQQTHIPIASIGYAVGSRTIAGVVAEAVKAPVSLARDECRVTLTSATDRALLADDADAAPSPQLRAFFRATVERSERWTREFSNKTEARDSALTRAIAIVGAQAAGAQRSDSSLVREIAQLESSWTRSEFRWQREAERQRLEVAVVALLATAGVTGAVGAYSRARGANAKANHAAARADEALRLARIAIEAAERAAAQRLNGRERGEVWRIWNALDQLPTHSVRRMSVGERARLFEQSRFPSGRPAVVLEVEDAQGPRAVALPEGTTAYVGRDREAMSVVAQRYIVPHVLLAIQEPSGDCIVSRCHCSIAHVNGRLEVIDLSSNGTFLESTGARLAFGEARVVRRATTLSLARRRSPLRIHVSAATPSVALN